MAATEPDANGSVPALPTDSARGRGRASARVLALLGAVALAVVGLDQLSKSLVVAQLEFGRSIPVLGELLQFRYVTNSGAAFSLAGGLTWVLSIVAIGVIAVIVWFAPRIRSRAWSVMFGLVLGGAIGNLIDRLFRPPGFGVGHVVDFLQLYAFPAVFNVADVAIVSSMALFVLLSIRGIGLDGRHERGRAAA